MWRRAEDGMRTGMSPRESSVKQAVCGVSHYIAPIFRSAGRAEGPDAGHHRVATQGPSGAPLIRRLSVVRCRPATRALSLALNSFGYEPRGGDCSNRLYAIE